MKTINPLQANYFGDYFQKYIQYSLVLNLNNTDLYIYLKYIKINVKEKNKTSIWEINFKKIVSAANIINQW